MFNPLKIYLNDKIKKQEKSFLNHCLLKKNIAYSLMLN